MFFGIAEQFRLRRAASSSSRDCRWSWCGANQEWRPAEESAEAVAVNISTPPVATNKRDFDDFFVGSGRTKRMHAHAGAERCRRLELGLAVGTTIRQHRRWHHACVKDEDWRMRAGYWQALSVATEAWSSHRLTVFPSKTDIAFFKRDAAGALDLPVQGGCHFQQVETEEACGGACQRPDGSDEDPKSVLPADDERRAEENEEPSTVMPRYIGGRRQR